MMTLLLVVVVLVVVGVMIRQGATSLSFDILSITFGIDTID